MESTRQHQIKVGLFLLIGTIVIISSIFMLGGNKALFTRYNNYKIFFEQVQGLNQGSVVSLSGLNIGNIESIEFSSEQNQIQVTIRVESQYADKIREGTTAEIRTQGALGDKFIYLQPGPSQNPLISENQIIPKQMAQDFLGVLSEKGNEATKVFEIISEIHKLIKTVNYDNRTDKIMTNMTQATGNLNESMLEIKKMIQEVRGQDAQSNQIKTALVKLNSILEKVDRGDGTLGALINDPVLHQQLKSLLGANQKSQGFKNLMRSSIEQTEK